MSLNVFFLVIEMKSILVFVFHVSLYSLQSIINSGSYKERQNKFESALLFINVSFLTFNRRNMNERKKYSSHPTTYSHFKKQYVKKSTVVRNRTQKREDRKMNLKTLNIVRKLYNF
jgi:hypothetical protein